MGLFSFGGSKSKSSSSGESFSSSFSNQQAASFDRATSSSISGGSSLAGSQDASMGQSRQALAFEDVFARLFGSAEATSAALDTSMLTEAANTLFSGGTGFLDSIGGDAGSQYMRDRLQESNPYLEEQIGYLGADISEFLNEEILPGIQGNAIAAGQLGGSRQGVAQGEAAEAALEEFTRGASNLRYGDVSARDAIASSLGQQTVAGAQVGTGALQQLAGIADMGYGAAFDPIMRLASVLGGPTVLTQSDSASRGSSFSTAQDFARALSESFGQSASVGVSGSQSYSKTQSKGKGGSVDIGFG